MFKLLFLFIVLFCSVLAFSQEKALKLIKKGKYDKAYKYIKKELIEEPNDVILNFALTKLFCEIDYKKNNIDSAYCYIKKTEKYFYNIDDKTKKNLREVINYDSIKIKKNEICLTAYNKIKRINTIESCEAFLSYYDDSGYLISEAIKLRNSIAFDQAIKQNTVIAFQNFINKYPNANEIRDAITKRNNLAFHMALENNTIDSYQNFIESYPDAVELTEAINNRNSLAYQVAVSKNTVASYQYFIAKYPKSNELNEAIINRDKIAFQQADSVNTKESYYDFIQQYPNSHLYDKAKQRYEILYFLLNVIQGNVNSYISFIGRNSSLNHAVKLAEDSLYYYSKLNSDIKGMKYYIDNCKFCNKSDSLNIEFFNVFTSDGDISSIDEFLIQYPDLVDFSIIQNAESIAIEGKKLIIEYNVALYQKKPVDSFTKKIDAFIKKAAPRHLALVFLQLILKSDIKNKNFDAALKILSNYEIYFGANNKIINNLKELLGAKIDRSIQIKSFGPVINTKGNEYCPIVSADNKTLYFCGKERIDNIGGEDIFTCDLINNTKPKVLSDLSTRYSNDAPESISTDGTELILFKSGDIYKSNKTYYGWSTAVPIDESEKSDYTYDDDSYNYSSNTNQNSKINTDDWEGGGIISSNNEVLMFASDKPGAVGFCHKKDKYYCGSTSGNIDIYVAFKNSNGTWSNPINIGSDINTPFCERDPFLHPDMKTLYFSSNGHGGLGEIDVFKTVRLYDTSWVYWSEPINMGKEINTCEQDWGYKISTDGEKAFFAKLQNNSDEDIFFLNLPPYLRPNFVATISGKLVNKDKKPVIAKIKWEDLETGKQVGESKSDPSDGSFFIVLPLGKIYGYYIDKDEVFPLSNNIDLRNEKKVVEIEKNIDVITFKEMIEEGIAVPVNNLFFFINEHGLLPASLPELKRVAQIIKSKNLKVEISGHTDSIGTVEHNLILSEQRANAVKEFLVKEGCNINSLTTIGFGNTKPIDLNSSEEGRARNRRVELKFIK